MYLGADDIPFIFTLRCLSLLGFEFLRLRGNASTELEVLVDVKLGRRDIEIEFSRHEAIVNSLEFFLVNVIEAQLVEVLE